MAEQIKVICINNCKMINEPYDWEDTKKAHKGNTYYISIFDIINVSQYVWISEWDESTKIFWSFGVFEAKNFMTPHELRERLINKILEE
jgi:hypothetical protein